MRFMNFVSCPEDLGPPPQSLIDAMEQAAQDAARAGTLLDSGGLAPVARGTRVRVSGGKLTVMDGPFAEGKEVVGGYGVVEAASREEAVEGAVWLMNMHLQHWPGWEGEIEVRQILDPEDSAPPAQP
jgi:hypothetical protein